MCGGILGKYINWYLGFNELNTLSVGMAKDELPIYLRGNKCM